MTTLNTHPGSSTKRQRQTLVITGRRRGFELNEIRKMVGGSVTRLSAAECSKWIEHFTGKGLPNPPGQKPRPYQGKPAPGTIRMITQDHIEQIVRLGLMYFGKRSASRHTRRSLSGLGAWLRKNFDEVPYIEPLDRDDLLYMVRSFASAKRASEVIKVLKDMHARREAGGGKRQNGLGNSEPVSEPAAQAAGLIEGNPHARTIW